MIDLYTFTTPNGRKASVMLEEVGLPYDFHKVDITKNEQFTPEYKAINPNSKIPAIIDRDTGITVFESGAILIYLAEKTDSKLLPTNQKDRFQVLEWLMFQMGSVGPMFGQLNHFKRFASEKISYAIERYEKETLRLYGVLDRQLNNEFICGDYSIADVATYPWVATYEFQGLTLDNHLNLKRWIEAMQQRPAVQRGMKVPA